MGDFQDRTVDCSESSNSDDFYSTDTFKVFGSLIPSGGTQEHQNERLLIKDRAHFLSQVSAEGKIDQMRDLETEKEFRAHTWSFDSTHEYFHS